MNFTYQKYKIKFLKNKIKQIKRSLLWLAHVLESGQTRSCVLLLSNIGAEDQFRPRPALFLTEMHSRGLEQRVISVVIDLVFRLGFDLPVEGTQQFKPLSPP